jgi:hypothetical protein
MKTSSSSSLMHARQSIAGERPPRRAVFRDHLVTADLHVDVLIFSTPTGRGSEEIRAQDPVFDAA